MFKTTSLFLWIIMTFLCDSSPAEYRVFLLHIKNKSTQKVQTLKSTLDPEQYHSLYPQLNSEITYTDTWMCRGDTSYYTPLCEQPQNVQTSPNIESQTRQ
jgi:hypothetical protein